MVSDKAQKDHIVEGLADLLKTQGPPTPSYGQIAEFGNFSRQLVRFYFDELDDLSCQVCDLLAEAYCMALVNGVDTL